MICWNWSMKLPGCAHFIRQNIRTAWCCPSGQGLRWEWAFRRCWVMTSWISQMIQCLRSPSNWWMTTWWDTCQTIACHETSFAYGVLVLKEKASTDSIALETFVEKPAPEEAPSDLPLSVATCSRNLPDFGKPKPALKWDPINAWTRPNEYLPANLRANRLRCWGQVWFHEKLLLIMPWSTHTG